MLQRFLESIKKNFFCHGVSAQPLFVSGVPRCLPVEQTSSCVFSQPCGFDTRKQKEASKLAEFAPPPKHASAPLYPQHAFSRLSALSPSSRPRHTMPRALASCPFFRRNRDHVLGIVEKPPRSGWPHASSPCAVGWQRLQTVFPDGSTGFESCLGLF